MAEFDTLVGSELYRLDSLGPTVVPRALPSLRPLILSPNPASAFLTLTWPDAFASPHTAHLLSPTGALLRTFPNLRAPTATFPVADLPPGLYFLRLTDAATGAPAGTSRFIKQ